jgi:indolepyruvate ferredoxin oxidoreductase
LVVGCDPIVTASKETLLRMCLGRTHVAMNGSSTPTAAFVKNGDWQNPAEQCVAEIVQQVGESHVGRFDAETLAKQLMGDTIYVNPMVLGYAWQKGWVPLHRESLLRAMELNEVQVKNNQLAFEWGRHAAHHLQAVMQLLQPSQVIQFHKRESLDDVVQKRVTYLTEYQDVAYAARYSTLVSKVRQAESPLNKTLLTDTVARNLFKLMAYKDEYEVARLHTDPAFLQRIADQFEGDYKVHYHLAPPLIAKRNDKGQLVKQKFGPGMLTAFKLLAKLKGLRGTALDVFGHTEERQTEKALIGEYIAIVEQLISTLDTANHVKAVDIAKVPESIKGFGHVKERNLAAARQRWADLLKA